MIEENPYESPEAPKTDRRRRSLGEFIDQLDDGQKDMLLLAIGLFVIAPLFYFLFYW